MYLEFSSPLHAQEAVKMTNGYKLDKQHTFAVNLFSDLEHYRNIPDEWEEPEIRPYEDKVCRTTSVCHVQCRTVCVELQVYVMCNVEHLFV